MIKMSVFLYRFAFVLCELVVDIGSLTSKGYYVRTVDKTNMNTVSIGYTTAAGCVGKCTELECCKATYIESTSECRIGQTSCCNEPDITALGVNLYQYSTPKDNPVAGYVSVTNGLDIGTWKTEELCHPGHYAIGYKIKGEDLAPDYSGTNSIEIICGSRTGQVCGDNVTSGSHLWISFEREILCPLRTFLISFNMQVDPFNPIFYDNSGTNWIKFRCRKLNQLVETTEIEASKADKTFLKGNYSDWSNSCPVGTAICGIQTRILENQGALGDDMAVTDVRFRCCY